MMGLSISIYAHTEPRTEPLTTSEIQAKGKTRAMLKACKRLKKQQRIKHDRLCGR